MTEVRDEIARALDPLRERRELYARKEAQLREQLEEARAAVREFDRVIAAAEPREQRKRKQRSPRAGRSQTGEEKRYALRGVADAKIDEVLALVRRVEEPLSTGFVASHVQLGASSVGRVLGYLADEGLIRRAGQEPGVRGRRLLYARWPEEVSGNGAEKP